MTRARDPEDRLYTVMLVLVGVIIVLIPTVIYLVVTVDRATDRLNQVEGSFSEVIGNQTEAKVRECSTLAQEGRFFPTSCLDEDVLDRYGRDVLRVLDESHEGQVAVRDRICRRFDEVGIEDTDCR